MQSKGKNDLKAQQYVNFLSDHESVFSYNFGFPVVLDFFPKILYVP